MNMIELTCVLSILSGTMAGIITGKDYGIGGMVFGAILGFTMGRGIAWVLGRIDQATSSFTSNRGAILSLGISIALGLVGPLLTAASVVAVALLIERFL